MEPQKIPNSNSDLQERTKLEESCYLISNYTIRPQTSKQHSTGLKTDTQINGTEQSPEINPCIYSQLIFDRRNKHIQWAKDSLFNKWRWGNQIDTYRNIKLGHLSFKRFFIYLFLERGEGKGEREEEKHQCVVSSRVSPLLMTWPTTQACMLTEN